VTEDAVVMIVVICSPLSFALLVNTENLSCRHCCGVIQIVNQHLLKDLTELGLWNDDMKHKMIAHNGSIQVTNTTVHYR